MAAECKTVEFVFPTKSGGVSAGVGQTLSRVEIQLPEVGITFRSVTLEVGCTDDFATGLSTATFVSVTFALVPAASDKRDVFENITNTGESRTYHVGRDLTDYFAQFYSETARTAEVEVAIGGVPTNNHWAKLRITYEYDAASPRQVKTIWVPIESTRDLLTTGYQSVGGDAAIPAIKGGTSIIPEHDPVVRQVWVELIANQATSNSTSFNLDLRLGGDTTEQTALYRANAMTATPTWLHAIWDLTSSALDRPQELQAKLTGVSGRVAQVCGWVGITYEFAPTGTSLVWNSLLLPAFDREDQYGAFDASRAAVHVTEVWIEEPETISLRPSQVFAFFDTDGASSQLSLGVGIQTPRDFAVVAGGAPMVVGQRIDADGASADGVSLNRGRNQLKIKHHGDPTGGKISAINGFVLLNYTSGKATAGVGAHNQTRHFGLGWFDAGGTRLEYSSDTGSRTPEIPFEQYFINGVAMQLVWMSSSAGHRGAKVLAERTGDEGPAGDGAGWDTVYRAAINATSEGWLRWTTGSCSELFRRWTGDRDERRMDLRSGRRWAVVDAAQLWVGSCGLLVTYHAIAFGVRGSVTGAAAQLDNVEVIVAGAGSGESLLKLLADSQGRYQGAWFDDTEALVAEVLTRDGLVGRSAPFFAAGVYEPPAGEDPDPLLHHETHESGGTDEINVTGLAGVLAEPQVPSVHASTHAAAGADALRIDELAEAQDTTTLDASTTRHGLLPKLSGSSAEFLRGDGAWASLPAAPMPEIFLPASQVYLQSGLSAATLAESAGEKPFVSFPDSLYRYASWFFQLPASYAGGNLNFRLWYSGDVGLTADVDLGLFVERLTAGQYTSASNTYSSVIGSVPGPSNANQLHTFDFSRNNAQMDGAAAGDLVRIVIYRRGSVSNDAYTGAFHLYAVQISQV